MRLADSKTLILGVLAITLFGDCPEVLASRKLNQTVAHSNDVERALSANEALLLRFQNERQELLKNRAKDKAAYLVKNKLKILDGKIGFLEKEIQRTKKRSPVLKLKPYAPMELRRRLFLAANPRQAKMLPAARPEGRLEPATAVLPARVDWQGLKRREPWQEPTRAKETVKTPTPSVITVAWGKGVKTGADWKAMSRADKEIYVLSVMGNLSHRDVFLEKPYGFYIDGLDGLIQSNSALEAQYVHDLLITIAYESETDFRRDIDKIRK